MTVTVPTVDGRIVGLTLTDRIYPRIIASLWGPPKSGKTHLGLTFPTPIYAIEIGETGTEDWFMAHPDVPHKYEPIIIPDLVPKLSDHEMLLANFEEKLMEAVDSEYKTLVIDSTSRLWRSIRAVKTDETFRASTREKPNQADYEGANDYMEQVVQVARKNRGLNLVFVHRHREVFRKVDGKLQDTGDIESRDYRGMENLVTIQIRTGKAEFFMGKDKPKVMDFAHTIELCRYQPELEGQMIRRLDYNKLMEIMFND